MNSSTSNVWDNLPLENKTWLHDKIHASGPFSPAAQVLQGEYLEKGFNRAFDTYGLPYQVNVRFFNEYYYINIPPFQNPMISPEILQEHIKIYHDCIKNYPHAWHKHYLPKMNEHNRAFANYAMGSDIKTLQSEFADFIARAKDLWFIHGLNFLPMFLAPSQFIRKCQESGIDDTALIFDSLISLSNQTTDMGKTLLQIVKVIEDQKLTDIFSLHNNAIIWDKLSKSEDGQEVLKMSHEFMEKFGARNDFCLEISKPLWKETPYKIINLIRPQLQQDADFFEKKQQDLKKRKSSAYVTIKNYVLKKNPAWISEFEQWYQAACLAIGAQEDHNYYIEQRIIAQSREFYLRFNKLLFNHGSKQDEEDIFMLKPQEILDLCRKKNIDPYKLIRQRKARYEKALTLQAPECLGTINPQDIKSTPLNQSIADFFGEKLPQQNVMHTLKGHGIGRKKITAHARVLSSLDEAALLQPGEILVVATPSPAWTSLFAIAGALITEQGGRLCHTAIVAREYDLPAIVGVPNAVKLIRTGDWIELDPMEGIVHYRGKIS